jgi:hypothetical protein
MTRTVLLLTLIPLLLSPVMASGSGIAVSGPEARVVNSEILVTTGLSLDERNLDDLKKGIAKEITFHVDLFRVWKTWPDEFITGKKLVKTLWSDPIKKEYIATSFDGATLIEKRFRNFDSMLNWTLNIKDLRLINTKEIQPSDYFVKVTAISRLRSLPPVIGYLLFFVPEREFKVLKDSAVLTVGGEK